MIQILLPALIALVLLVLIHSYFGTHVIRRGIIFVDLALAQWAALGYLVAHVLHIEPPLLVWGCALGFTGIAALLLATFHTKYNHDTTHHTQEAHIGVMYLLATAIATVLMSTSGIEGHHFSEMLVGHILFVTWSDIALAAVLYLVVALVHKAFFSKLETPHSTLWHFIFYATFGVVVTSSVKMAGVLVVFALLIIPSLIAIQKVVSFRAQLLYSYLLSLPTCLIGVAIGYVFNIPIGHAVILSLCALWGVKLIRFNRTPNA